MKFLQKGLEYNRMAKAFGHAFVALNRYEAKFNSGLMNDYYELKQNLLILAFLCKRDILKRMEKFGWAMGAPISVPLISRGKITLLFAYQKTIGRLNLFADQLKIRDEINKILEEESNYKIMKCLTPDNIEFQTAFIGKVLMRFRYRLIVCAFLKEGEILKETDNFIVIQSPKLILKLDLNDDELTVHLSTYNIINGWYEKEWCFKNNEEDNEIILKMFNSSFLVNNLLIIK